MGLASFNRMRRERKPVERLEAERFAEWNKRHNERRLDRDNTHVELNEDEIQETIREEESAAMGRIGDKVIAGIKEGEKKNGVIDKFLREDHAAEIAGRNLVDVDQPKDPVARVDERVPDNTANEKLVAHTSVNRKGPSKAMVEAAQREAGVIDGDGPDEGRQAAADEAKTDDAEETEEARAKREAEEASGDAGVAGSDEEKRGPDVAESETQGSETVPAAGTADENVTPEGETQPATAPKGRGRRK
jgi:hypothetical protein